MASTRIETRLRQSTKKKGFPDDDLIVGADYITNGHWIAHRGVFIRQGLTLGEPASDGDVLRGMGFMVKDHELKQSMVDNVLLVERTYEEDVTYHQTSWLWEGPRVGTCRMLRENNGPRWCLVQDAYLKLVAPDDRKGLLRPTNGKHEGTILVTPGKEFGVLPTAKGNTGDELFGLDSGKE